MVNSGNGSALERNRILDTGHESRGGQAGDRDLGAKMAGLVAEMRRAVAFN